MLLPPPQSARSGIWAGLVLEPKTIACSHPLENTRLCFQKPQQLNTDRWTNLVGYETADPLNPPTYSFRPTGLDGLLGFVRFGHLTGVMDCHPCRAGKGPRHRNLNPWDFRGIPRTFRKPFWSPFAGPKLGPSPGASWATSGSGSPIRWCDRSEHRLECVIEKHREGLSGAGKPSAP